ncbi:hypothetical protein GCM10022198_02560 [Klugiella xanthotipulae]|uniref:DUF4131 domain-containing protein n=1 Tax=Klugiella xanthotipulae TaxID=244735 RepID=A0A543I4W9_9MICO|nr:hypothetical protein FB466_0415 [Klugiella xanthotipulae]
MLIALGIVTLCLVAQSSGVDFPGGMLGSSGVVLVLLGLMIFLHPGRDGVFPGVGRGSIAIATILSVHDTGGRGGINPRVRCELFVRRVGGESYVASTFFHVASSGPFSLAALRPGAMVAVRCRPGSVSRVRIARGLSPLHAQWALDRIRLAEGEVECERLDVVREGRETRALVLSCRPTGDIVGDYPWMVLGLRVYREDGDWFLAEVRVAVPLPVIPRLSAGTELVAFYRREEEADIAVILPIPTAGVGIRLYA